MLMNKDIKFLNKISAYQIQGLIQSTCVKKTRTLSVILYLYLVFGGKISYCSLLG